MLPPTLSLLACLQGNVGPPLCIILDPPTQVFGRDKSMSIVAIMHLEGLEGHFDVMLQEAIKVGGAGFAFLPRWRLAK